MIGSPCHFMCIKCFHGEQPRIPNHTPRQRKQALPDTPVSCQVFLLSPSGVIQICISGATTITYLQSINPIRLLSLELKGRGFLHTNGTLSACKLFRGSCTLLLAEKENKTRGGTPISECANRRNRHSGWAPPPTMLSNGHRQDDALLTQAPPLLCCPMG